ncbi:MAG: serine hydrolase domain-containing protein [Bacteroidales bacterium]|nr:serine hydrolase domain-containing protein [Bacteroidales bacterium]
MLYIKQFISLSIILLLFTYCNKNKQNDQVEENIKIVKPLNEIFSNKDSEFDQTKRFDRNVERFINKWNITGASLVVMKNDSLIYAKGYGFADKEHNIRMDVNNIFRVASVSKLITATAIMKLCEEGKLSLDSKIFGHDGILNDSVYLSYRDKKIENITVENLLRHQGGFSRGQGDPMFDYDILKKRTGAQYPFTCDDVITYILKSRLPYRPGTVNSYSNIGYAVLEKVIEKCSNTNYETYVRNYILLPAGCFNMHLGNSYPEEAYRNEVHYYEQPDQDLVPNPADESIFIRKCNGGNDIKFLGAAGGWIASPIELARLVVSISGSPLYDQVLKKRSIQRMIEPVKNTYPLGWIAATEGGELIRTGTMSGTSALIRYKKNDFSYIFVTNTSTYKGSSLSIEIRKLMDKELNNVKNWPSRNLFEASM